MCEKEISMEIINDRVTENNQPSNWKKLVISDPKVYHSEKTFDLCSNCEALLIDIIKESKNSLATGNITRHIGLKEVHIFDEKYTENANFVGVLRLLFGY
jgi:hypothetical protein